MSYKSRVTQIVSEESKEICAIRDVLLRKKCILLYFTKLPPPAPSPQLFPVVEIQDLKVTLGLKILYLH